jgi:hypothetical protein
MTLDDLLRALDLLDEQKDLPPLLRQLTLLGLLCEVRGLLPQQDAFDFNDEAVHLEAVGAAMIREGQAERQRGERLVSLATMMNQAR